MSGVNSGIKGQEPCIWRRPLAWRPESHIPGIGLQVPHRQLGHRQLPSGGSLFWLSSPPFIPTRFAEEIDIEYEKMNLGYFKDFIVINEEYSILIFSPIRGLDL